MIAKRVNKVQTLTEFIDEQRDVYNLGEWIDTGDKDENIARLTRIRKIFSQYGIDLIEEGEGIEFSVLGLVFEAQQSAEARLETSTGQIEANKTLYTLLIEKLAALIEDPRFCQYLGLDLDEIQNRLTKNELALATLDGKRAGQVKPMKYYLRIILPYLKSKGLGETTRVNLIRDLFVECEVPRFGTDHRDRGYLEEKALIREWDREIMQAPRSDSPQ